MIAEPTLTPSDIDLPPYSPPESPDPIYHFRFTGDGYEYFRIWIVNLCLTIATLGIYSAWAKVRRLQYFDRNTELAGATFNFHGRPIAILRGRLLGLVLLICYHYAFGFSRIFGVVVISFLVLSFPWLLRSALRFRLRNTSYRGLHFEFNGSLAGAYVIFIPVLAIFVLPAATIALNPELIRLALWEMAVLYLSWPVIHGAIRRYQQSSIEYGDSASRYHASSFALVKTYLLALVLVIGSLLLGGLLAAVLNIAVRAIFGDGLMSTIMIIVSMIAAYAGMLAIGLYAQVRIWNLAWNKTDFPQFTIQSRLVFGPYLFLQTENLIMTLLTLGLFRPFAAVRSYRYRLSCMSVTMNAGSSLDQIAQSTTRTAGSAAGDSSADLFGFDLSF